MPLAGRRRCYFVLFVGAVSLTILAVPVVAAAIEEYSNGDKSCRGGVGVVSLQSAVGAFASAAASVMTDPREALSSLSFSGGIFGSPLPGEGAGFPASLVGTPSGEYGCVHSGVNGTLYVGTSALYFVGTIFFFDKTVLLTWEDVRVVEHGSGGSENSIDVVCKDGTVYSFEDIPSPGRVWTSLVSLHNGALFDPPAGREVDLDASVATSSRPRRRRNSDPLRSSQSNRCSDDLHYLDGDDDDMDGKRSFDQDDPPLSPTRGDEEHHSTSSSRSVPPRSSSFTLRPGPKHSDVESYVGRFKLRPTACRHAQVAGTLYAGGMGIFFFGKKFPWDQRAVMIHAGDVEQIQIVTPVASDREVTPERGRPHSEGVRVIVRDGTVHDFTGMDDPHDVWTCLNLLHDDDHRRGGADPSKNCSVATSATPQPRKHRRMSSDPLLGSHSLIERYAAAGGGGNAGRHQPSGDDGGEPHSVRDDPLSSSPPSSPREKAAGLADQWKALTTEDRKGEATIVVVTAQKLQNCTLDKYYDLFVANDAPYSIAKFLEQRGDSDLRASDWEATEDVNSNNCRSDRDCVKKWTRVVHYTHPVNAPMAPPKAAARKEQTYRRYGPHGLCLQTETHVDDVPMADCFVASDRILVHPSEDSARGDGADDDKVTGTAGSDVVLRMEFSITFVKSTMFKGIISKTTTKEFTSLLQALSKFLTDSLEESNGREEEEGGGEPERTMHPAAVAVPVRDGSEPAPESPSQPPAGESPSQHVLIGAVLFLFAVVIVMQVWIVYEIRGIKSALQSLETRETPFAEPHVGDVCQIPEQAPEIDH